MIVYGKFTEIQSDAGPVMMTCDAIAQRGGCKHGFVTRKGGVGTGYFSTINSSVLRGEDPAALRENYRRMGAAFGQDDRHFCYTRQVHQDEVRTVTAMDAGDFTNAAAQPPCDGLVTDQPGLILVSQYADCVPLLFYDPVKRVCASVHAGWRGTVLRIAEKAVWAMRDRFGCDPGDILAAVGPAIGPCCFLTHDDVYDAVREQIGALADTAMRPAEDGRWHIDLKEINARIIHAAGAGRVDVITDCTSCVPDRYFSHRRDKEARGNHPALIMLTDAAG